MNAKIRSNLPLALSGAQANVEIVSMNESIWSSDFDFVFLNKFLSLELTAVLYLDIERVGNYFE